jgi:hypothetical protein
MRSTGQDDLRRYRREPTLRIASPSTIAIRKDLDERSVR